MHRFIPSVLAAIAVLQGAPLSAQAPRSQSLLTTLAFPSAQDSIRLWHRFLADSSVSLLIADEFNPWLQRGYEFTLPLGRNPGRLRLCASLDHPDSLTLSCSGSDLPCSGYRLMFSREPGGFGFRRAEDVQVFRSGVERICDVPLRIREEAGRIRIWPGSGRSACWYRYHRQLLVSFP